MKWMNWFHWFPWRCSTEADKLEAALDANTAAYQTAAHDEAKLGYRLKEQKQRTETTLRQIQDRAARGHQTNPGLVTIAETLKGLEKSF